MNTDSFQDMHWLLDIIQSIDIGIVVLDKDFNIEIFNRFMQVHSNISAQDAMGNNVFSLFPYLNNEWFKRRVTSVIELGIPVYTTWEQRDSVFNFDLKLPIHYETRRMYQNSTFVPIRSSTDAVEKVGIIVYDVTESAVNRTQLEQAKDQLLGLSRTDRLTSLWNRGYWEERMTEEFQRGKRNDSSACLVMLDIDHFKKVNDTYGHQVGDEAIRKVSKLITVTSREVDICGRYGGEEFATVLPDTDIDGAMIYCERLREAIAEAAIESGKELIHITVSLGIAELDAHTKYPTDWIVNADKALYRSKHRGRNRTSVFGQ